MTTVYRIYAYPGATMDPIFLLETRTENAAVAAAETAKHTWYRVTIERSVGLQFMEQADGARVQTGKSIVYDSTGPAMRYRADLRKSADAISLEGIDSNIRTVQSMLSRTGELDSFSLDMLRTAAGALTDLLKRHEATN